MNIWLKHGTLLLLLSLTACSGHHWRIRPAEGKHQKVSQEQRLMVLRKNVNPLLEKKHYRRALEVVTDRQQPHQPVVGMEKEYLAAVNGLLELGEEALSSSDYGDAGQNFNAALDVYPVESSLIGKIKVSERRLKVYLETCSNKLMEKGLEEYRRGELDKAIKTWKVIIAFSADRNDARKAIETATVQKKSLHEMDIK